jgi:hypothetical protein
MHFLRMDRCDRYDRCDRFIASVDRPPSESRCYYLPVAACWRPDTARRARARRGRPCTRTEPFSPGRSPARRLFDLDSVAWPGPDVGGGGGGLECDCACVHGFLELECCGQFKARQKIERCCCCCCFGYRGRTTTTESPPVDRCIRSNRLLQRRRDRDGQYGKQCVGIGSTCLSACARVGVRQFHSNPRIGFRLARG